jgi:hypothetical protein
LRGGSFLEQDQIQVGGVGGVMCFVVLCYVHLLISVFHDPSSLSFSFPTSSPLRLSFTPSSYLSLSQPLPHFPHHIASHHTNSHHTVGALAEITRTRSGQLQTQTVRWCAVSPRYQRIHGKLYRRLCITYTANILDIMSSIRFFINLDTTNCLTFLSLLYSCFFLFFSFFLFLFSFRLLCDT